MGVTESVKMVAIYDSPSDLGPGFHARMWNGTVPGELLGSASTLAAAQQLVPAHMCRLGRMPEDDPVIVEVWV